MIELNQPVNNGSAKIALRGYIQRDFNSLNINELRLIKKLSDLSKLVKQNFTNYFLNIYLFMHDYPSIKT